MKEDLLHYIWKTGSFQQTDLRTTEGASVAIQSLGEYNTHAGPDFLNARILIDDTIWAGSVEMHLNASDWIAHRHQEDAAYHNVVLHVVLNEDRIIKHPSGERIPCIELSQRISPTMASQYQKLRQSRGWIPCHAAFPKVNRFIKNFWQDRLLVERLEHKTTKIEAILQATQNHWDETFYRFLARNFGFKVNAAAFDMLAANTPLTILSKHQHDLFEIEAILFGQAGMLDKDFQDIYPRQLKREYEFMRNKYNLMPIPEAAWKFMRLRPANFPTIRIAQLARLIHQSAHLFSSILNAKDLSEIELLLSVSVEDYWKSHYRFDKKANRKISRMGKSTIHLLIINTIVPFMFLFGQNRNKEDVKRKAIQLLEHLPPEHNQIIQGWQNLNEHLENAFQTQAYIHLKTTYCDQHRCLECAIGNQLLKADTQAMSG